MDLKQIAFWSGLACVALPAIGLGLLVISTGHRIDDRNPVEMLFFGCANFLFRAGIVLVPVGAVLLLVRWILA